MARLDQIQEPAVREALRGFQESVERNLAVTRLRNDLPIPASFLSLQEWRDPIGVLQRKKLQPQGLNAWLASHGLAPVRVPHWYPRQFVAGNSTAAGTSTVSSTDGTEACNPPGAQSTTEGG